MLPIAGGLVLTMPIVPFTASRLVLQNSPGLDEGKLIARARLGAQSAKGGARKLSLKGAALEYSFAYAYLAHGAGVNVDSAPRPVFHHKPRNFVLNVI